MWDGCWQQASPPQGPHLLHSFVGWAGLSLPLSWVENGAPGAITGSMEEHLCHRVGPCVSARVHYSGLRHLRTWV